MIVFINGFATAARFSHHLSLLESKTIHDHLSVHSLDKVWLFNLFPSSFHFVRMTTFHSGVTWVKNYSKWSCFWISHPNLLSTKCFDVIYTRCWLSKFTILDIISPETADSTKQSRFIYSNAKTRLGVQPMKITHLIVNIFTGGRYMNYKWWSTFSVLLPRWQANAPSYCWMSQLVFFLLRRRFL